MLLFLKNNAMQIAGGCQVVVGLVLSFIPHLTAAETARIASMPTGLGTALAGMVITVKKNGNGKATT